MAAQRVLRRFGENPLLMGSIIIFAATIAASVFSYFFYVFAARELGPEQFSVLGVMLSLYLIVSVTTNVVSTVLIRFISHFKAKSQYDKISSLLLYSTLAMVLAGFGFFAAFFLLRQQIAEFLHVTPAPVVALGLFIWAFFVVTAFLSFLNGMQRFGVLGFNRIAEAFLTLVFGYFLIKAGFGVVGALAAMFAAAMLTIPISALFLNQLFKVRRGPIGEIGMAPYLLLAAAASVAVAIILNIDLVIVKKALDARLAGYYAATSLIGSIPFFVSTAVGSVLFPKAAELHSDGKDSSGLLRDGLLYTGAICLAITLLYAFLPELVSRAFFGPEYEVVPYLAVYAAAMSFLSLTNVIVTYNLALKKARMLLILMPAAIAYTAVISLVAGLRIEALNAVPLMHVVLAVFALQLALLAAMVLYDRQEFIEIWRHRSGYRHYPLRYAAKMKIK